MRTFQFRPRRGWWERVGNRWVNSAGGYHYVSKADKITGTIKARNWAHAAANPLMHELEKKDYLAHEMEDEFNGHGWMDLRGKIYAIRYSQHIAFASAVMNCTERELELKGWVKISSNTAYHCKPLTRSQQRALDALVSTGGVAAIYEVEGRKPWAER